MKRNLILMFGIILGISMDTFAESELPLSANEVLSRYSEMISRLNRISARIKVKGYSSLELNPPKSYLETDLSVCRDGNNLEFFGTGKSFDSNGTYVKSRIVCHLFKAGRHYLAAKWPVDGKPLMAQIDNDNFERDLCLNLNAPDFGGALWSRVDGCACKSISELLRDSGEHRLFESKEIINCLDFYVLSGSTKYGTVTAWIASQKSYNAVKWTVKKGPNDFYNEYRIKDKTLGDVNRIFEAVDFEKIGDTFVVSKGRITATNTDAKGEDTLIYEYDVSEIELNPDFQALDSFKLRIPDGTPVVITEHPGMRYVWKEGKAVPDVNGATFDEIDKTIDRLKQQQ